MPAPYTSKLKHLRLPERHWRAVLRLANAQACGMQLQPRCHRFRRVVRVKVIAEDPGGQAPAYARAAGGNAR